MKPSTRVGAVAVASMIASGVVWAQVRGGGAEWLTAAGDAQHTSWIRTDASISVDAMSQPGFELQWKAKLNNQPRLSSGLSQGVTANGVTLFVPLSLITGSSNNVYALDNDTGYELWAKHFDAPLPAPTAACPGGITGAATRIVNVAPAPLAAGGGGARGGGGGRGYSSNVSEPGAGITPPAPRGGGGGGGGARPGGPGAAPGAPGGAPGAAPGAPAPPPAAGAPPAAAAGAPAGAAPAAGRGVVGAGAQGGGGGGNRGGGAANAGIPGAPNGGGPGGGFGRPGGVVYVVSSDGMLHVLGLPSGKEMQKPAPFLPANARSSDLIAVNTTLYAATSQNCGGAPNGVWAIDLESEAKPVMSWKTNGGSVVGGVTVGTDGALLVSVGAGQAGAGGYANAVVALDPKTLQPKDWFTLATAEPVAAPLVFRENDKDIVVVPTKDGRILLLDGGALGGANHATPMFAWGWSTTGAAGMTIPALGGLAMWQEAVTMPAPAGATAAPPAAAQPPGAPGAPPAAPIVIGGTRWLLASFVGKSPTSLPGLATNGAVTNGAILALKVDNQSGKLSLTPGWVSRDLTSPSTPLVVNGVVFAASSGAAGTPAVLYGLNGTTGKELWSSGRTITSPLSGRSFWSANAQVYAGTSDGQVYAFGFANERK